MDKKEVKELTEKLNGSVIDKENAAKELLLHYLNKGKDDKVEELLKHKDSMVTKGAIRGLIEAAENGENISPYFPILEENIINYSGNYDLLGDSSAEALKAYGYEKIEKKDVKIKALLICNQKDDHEELLKMDNLVRILTDYLSDGSNEVRSSAAKTLVTAAIKDMDIEYAIPYLEKALDDRRSTWVREEAAKAMVIHYARNGDWKKIKELFKYGGPILSDEEMHRRYAPPPGFGYPQIGSWEDKLLGNRRLNENKWMGVIEGALDGAYTSAIVGIDISPLVPDLNKALGYGRGSLQRAASQALARHYVNTKDWENVKKLFEYSNVHTRHPEVVRGSVRAIENAIEMENVDVSPLIKTLEDSVLPKVDYDAGITTSKIIIQYYIDKKNWDVLEGLLERKGKKHIATHIGEYLDEIPEDRRLRIGVRSRWMWMYSNTISQDERFAVENAIYEELGDGAIPFAKEFLNDSDGGVVHFAGEMIARHYVKKMDWPEIEKMFRKESRISRLFLAGQLREDIDKAPEDKKLTIKFPYLLVSSSVDRKYFDEILSMGEDVVPLLHESLADNEVKGAAAGGLTSYYFKKGELGEINKLFNYNDWGIYGVVIEVLEKQIKDIEDKINEKIKEKDYVSALKIIKNTNFAVMKIFEGRKGHKFLEGRRAMVDTLAVLVNKIHDKMNPLDKKEPVKWQKPTAEKPAKKVNKRVLTK